MLIVMISATVLLTSCTQRLFDFTVVSSKNVTLNFKEGGKSTKRVEGKGGSIKSALDKAIEQAGGDYDALIDGVVYLSSYLLYCSSSTDTPLMGHLSARQK